MKGVLMISVGAIAGPLNQQLASQGLTLTKDQMVIYQNDLDAVSRCIIRGYITPSAAGVARRRITKQIAKDVRRLS